MSNLKVIKQESDPEIVCLFEEMKERAKTGEIQGVVLVICLGDRTAETLHEGAITLKTVANLEALKLEILLNCRSQAEDDENA